MTGDATVRRAEDVDSAALSYAEVKAIASGNPLVIEKASIDAEVMRLVRLQKQYTDSLYSMRRRIRGFNETANTAERAIGNIREDIRSRISTRGDDFRMTLRGRTFASRSEAGKELISIASMLEPYQRTKQIGAIGGFPISLYRQEERVSVQIHGKEQYTAGVSESAGGSIASIEHALSNFEASLKEAEGELQYCRKQSKELSKQLEKPFEHQSKLEAAALRQHELIKALEITKDQAAPSVSESYEFNPRIEEKAAKSITPRKGVSIRF